MGCCSPFSATQSPGAADPGRHVNFTSGMVLGVDDYVQEFAYHSARDKWIVRDAIGYGTLSGLAVDVEEDGSNGPRVSVSPGAAAAPSGQLICVRREQCGNINAWLAREDSDDAIRALNVADPSVTTMTLRLYLTLCYTDCAVAEVPIPGEPCRSAENLMAPSRIADDYCLEFRLQPPAMTESLALTALATVRDSVTATGAPAAGDAATIAEAVRRGGVQLLAALGLKQASGDPPAAADLAEIALDPADLPAFDAVMRRLWITRIRPLVAAQSCGEGAHGADDCVLLARLDMPLLRPNAQSKWRVGAVPAGETSAVRVVEDDRPLLLNAMATQTAPLLRSGPAEARFAAITVDGTVDITDGLVVVRADTDTKVKLPAKSKLTPGDTLAIRAAGAGKAIVAANNSMDIESSANVELAAGASITLAYDGDKTWLILARTEAAA